MTSYTHLNNYIWSHINEPSENRADGKNLIYQIWCITAASPHWLIGNFDEYQRLWLMFESTPSCYTDTVLKCFNGENICSFIKVENREYDVNRLPRAGRRCGISTMSKSSWLHFYHVQWTIIVEPFGLVLSDLDFGILCGEKQTFCPDTICVT